MEVSTDTSKGRPLKGGGKMKNLKITGIYDNTATERLIPGWGLSLLLEISGHRILFDTGSDLMLLSHNLDELDIGAGDLDTVVLSHPHCDHVGGLSAVLRENADLNVYITSSFPESLKEKVKSYGAVLVDESEPIQPCPGAITTGELKGGYRGLDLPEQGIILESDGGPVLISGCAHPGIVEMTKRAKEIVRGSPYLVLGGFHLGGKKEAEIEKVVEGLIDNSVENVAPTHCTGEKATEMIKSSYGDNFVDFEAGKRIDINGHLNLAALSG